MLTTLAEINPKKFDLKLLCPPGGDLENLAFEAGIPVRVTRSLHTRLTWRPDRWSRVFKFYVEALRSFRAQVIRESPELIHANTIVAGLAALLATIRLKTPVIWHLHQPPRKGVLRALLRWVAVLTPRVYLLAGSNSILNGFLGSRVLQFRFLQRRIRVIPPGVKLQQFVRDVESGREFRKRLGVGPDRFLIGAIGDLTPPRGQLELIEAFARAGLKEANLLIAGHAVSNDDRRYFKKLIDRIAELRLTDRVHLMEVPNDLAPLMRSLDLLVSNSPGEMYELELVEAMACGVPVLASAVEGVRDLIQHGSNGLLVPPGDLERLRSAMTTLCYARELRRKLSTNAARQIVPHYTSARFLSSVEEYYEHTRPQTAQADEVTLAA